MKSKVTFKDVHNRPHKKNFCACERRFELQKIWNVIDGRIQNCIKVPAGFEVWYFLPESGAHALAQINEF